MIVFLFVVYGCLDVLSIGVLWDEWFYVGLASRPYYCDGIFVWKRSACDDLMSNESFLPVEVGHKDKGHLTNSRPEVTHIRSRCLYFR
jgi:hypothetical protein